MVEPAREPPKISVGQPATLEGLAASLQALEGRLGELEKQHAQLVKLYSEAVPRLGTELGEFIKTYNGSMTDLEEFEKAVGVALNDFGGSLHEIAQFAARNFDVLKRTLIGDYPEVHSFAELEMEEETGADSAGPATPSAPLDLLGGLPDAAADPHAGHGHEEGEQDRH